MPTMKRIIISETQYRLFEEYQNELTFEKFRYEVLSFLKDLLEDPSNAKISEVLRSHNIDRSNLIQNMIDRGILTRNNKVTEMPSKNGKQKASMLVKYSVLRKNFDKKLHRLYIELCECTKPKLTIENNEDNGILDEDGSIGGMSCGFAMQGGGANPDAGQYTVPMGAVQKRKFWYKGNEENKKSSKKRKS